METMKMSTFFNELRTLVEIESPTEDLGACREALFATSEIIERHLTIAPEMLEENGRPILWWGTRAPRVLLLAHIDTVWPRGSYLPLWREEDGKIFGPGIFDMKAGILQAIYAIAEIDGAHESVAIAITTDEEVGSQTTREFIKERSATVQAVLVLEASLDGKVKVGRKGTSMYQVSVLGRAAHAGLDPEKGVNATVEIAHIISQLAALEVPEFGTTVVPTTLRSGTTTNTVPAEAILDIDSRSFLHSEMVRVESALKNMTPLHPEALITVTGGINRPPLQVESTSELYEIFERVAAELGVGPIGAASVGGASDGNFAASAGARVLDGLGAVGDGAHAPHEHILVASVEGRIDLLSRFIKELM